MKYGTLLYTTASLLVISSSVYAGLEKETKETCEKLGYTTPAAECEKTGAIPLLCPFYDVTEANGTLSLCVTKSCRGYPLWKEGNTYYHFNTAGNVVPAVPAEGKIEDYVATFKECDSGMGKDKRTYYRVESCKTTAINGVVPVYQSDICDVGCDRINKYPFDTHPGNLAGTVEECVDKDGTYYGYTKCNDGWDSDGHGRCNLSSCDIKVYSYTSDPNVEEYRGETETCKIGMNAYYKYLSCTDAFTFRKGVCVKKCQINTSSCKSTDMGGYKNWSCSFSTTKCRIGDLATINGNVVGVIVHLKTNETDKTRIIPDVGSMPVPQWGSSFGETTDIDDNLLPNMANIAAAQGDLSGKKNTYGIVTFAKNKGWEPLANYYPSANHCFSYTVTNCGNNSFCQQGEWYLPSAGEVMYYINNNKYILSNVLNSAIYNGYHTTSSELNSSNNWYVYTTNGNLLSSGKRNWGAARPMLAF